MSRLPYLEYRADILKGWPEGNALDLNYGSDDATLTNGDFVVMVANGKVAKCNKEAGAGTVGLVVRGPAEDKSARVAGGIAGGEGTKVVGGYNTCITLWGHYVVRTSNFADADVYAPGADVYVDDTGTIRAGAAGKPVLGQVLEIDTLADGKKALIVLVR